MANVEKLPNSSQSSSQEKMNIYLKVTKTVALKVTSSDTIRNLKAAIREKEGVSETFQELYYGGKCLKDDGNLDDCGIQENSTIHLVLQTSGVLKLNIKVSSRQKNIEVEAKTNDTVRNIKLMIQTIEGIDSDTYTLFYAGKLLENDSTLASIGVKDAATLNLVFNPREVVTLSIKRPTGGIVKTKVKILHTIRDVKEIIEGMFGFPAQYHYLVCGGQQLEDSLTLASYKINEESILEILPRGFQIFVKLWSGKTITLDVCQNDTVASLKSKIIKKIGDPVNSLEHLSLVHAGKLLVDDKDVFAQGVHRQSTLYTKPKLSTEIIFIKLSETEIEGDCRMHSVAYLKHIISEKLGRPVKGMLFKGKALQDHFMLFEYKLHADTELAIAI